MLDIRWTLIARLYTISSFQQTVYTVTVHRGKLWEYSVFEKQCL